MKKEPVYTLRPIGIISKESKKKPVLLVDPPYRPGLLHLEKFSHALIFWWAERCDNTKDRKILVVQPPIDRFPEAPPMGVFSTRSPARPNPIMISIVVLEEVDVKAGRLTLSYIDADDQTPLLDIKPYLPSSERVLGGRLPEWFESLNHPFIPPGPPR